MEKNVTIPVVAAVLIIIAIAASAAYVVINDDDDKSVDYQVYVEIVGADGKVTSSDNVKFTAEEKTNEAFVAAANAAFEKSGINAKFTLGDFISLVYGDSYSNACYYLSKGDWVAIDDTSTQYVNNSELALMLGNGYIGADVYNALSTAEQAGYKESGMSGAYAYAKLPDANSYEYYVEIIGADGKVTCVKTFEFTITKNTLENYVAVANKAFADVGLDAKFTLGDFISLVYGDSYSNACYYLSDDDWVAIDDTSTQYLANSTVALMLGNGYIGAAVYDALSTAEQAGYKESGMSGDYAYAKLPDKYDYTILYESVKDNGFVDRLYGERYFTNLIPSRDRFIAAFNDAFRDDAFIHAEVSNWGGISFKYGESGNTACYYVDNYEWVTVADTVTDYLTHTVLGFAFNNGYISTAVYDKLEPADQAGFKETGMEDPYAYVRVIKGYDYTVIYEVIKDDGTVDSTGKVTFPIILPENDYFMAGFNKAFEEAGVPAVFAQGKYGPSIKYDGSGSNACYYRSNDKWVEVAHTSTDYIQNHVLGFALGNGYISTAVYNALPAELKAGYHETGIGYGMDYMKDLEEFDYNVIYEIIKDDGTVDSTGKVTFTIIYNDNEYFMAGFNKAFEEAGVPAEFAQGKYGPSIKYDDSGNNACYYRSGDEWIAVSVTSTDYVQNHVLGFALGNGYISTAVYNALPAALQAEYKATGWGEPSAYAKLIKEFDYTVCYEVIKTDGTVDSTGKVTFTTIYKDNECFVAGFNKAFNDAALPVTAELNEYGVSVYYDEGFNNACYYRNGVEWVEVAVTGIDYVNNSVLGFAFGNGYIPTAVYNALPPELKAVYKETGMGYDMDYIKLLGVTPE